MHKKILTACIAAFALAALALPVAAQAANTPVITHPTGTVLNPTGKECGGKPGICISARNVGNSLMLDTSGNTQLTCTTVSMSGRLIKNTTAGGNEGQISAASFTGTGAEGRCTGFVNAKIDVLGLPWCLKSNSEMVTDEFTITSSACGAAAAKFKFQLTPSIGGTCSYESTKTSLRGTYTTHSTGDAILAIPRSGLTTAEKNTDVGFTNTHDTSPFSVCPSSSMLSMSLTLKTPGPATEQLYISS